MTGSAAILAQLGGWFLLGAAFGSVPFGLLIGMVFYRVDIRRHGSGNIGAANALRTIGRKGAALVLLLDALKGFVPAAFAVAAYHFRFGVVDTATAAAIAAASGAVLGHCFSPWLRFRGGKGIATLLGVLIALCWQAALAAVLVYATTVLLTRVSALGSLGAAIVGATALGWRTGYAGGLFGVGCVLLVFYTHRTNIARLLHGEELTVTRDAERNAPDSGGSGPGLP